MGESSLCFWPCHGIVPISTRRVFSPVLPPAPAARTAGGSGHGRGCGVRALPAAGSGVQPPCSAALAPSGCGRRGRCPLRGLGGRAGDDGGTNPQASHPALPRGPLRARLRVRELGLGPLAGSSAPVYGELSAADGTDRPFLCSSSSPHEYFITADPSRRVRVQRVVPKLVSASARLRRRSPGRQVGGGGCRGGGAGGPQSWAAATWSLRLGEEQRRGR